VSLQQRLQIPQVLSVILRSPDMPLYGNLVVANMALRSASEEAAPGLDSCVALKSTTLG